jgi:hypothetical protein
MIFGIMLSRKREGFREGGTDLPRGRSGMEAKKRIDVLGDKNAG